jgi:hypothetical protein
MVVADPEARHGGLPLTDTGISLVDMSTRHQAQPPGRRTVLVGRNMLTVQESLPLPRGETKSSIDDRMFETSDLGKTLTFMLRTLLIVEAIPLPRENTMSSIATRSSQASSMSYASTITETLVESGINTKL